MAHNAAFDREMLERLDSNGVLRFAPFEATWICSQQDYDWKADGAPSQSLDVLCWAHGMIPQPHRALNDARALANLSLNISPLHHTYLDEMID